MDPYIGEIRMVGFNYAPSGWATCDGQLLSIAQNSALFALLGTQFGGNGTSTFGLPDLRGRAAIHQGSGNGLTPRTMGQSVGEESVTLNINQMPSHIHVVAPLASNGDALVADPTGAIPANGGNNNYTSVENANAAMGSSNSSMTGGSQSHDNMPPVQVVNFIIALQGIFPPRQ